MVTVSGPVRPFLTSHAHKHACTGPTRMHRCLSLSTTARKHITVSVSVSLPANRQKALELLCWHTVAARTYTLRLRVYCDLLAVTAF